MALRIWLPLNGSLENKGISDITVTNNGATIDNNGKIGKCYNFDGTTYIKGSNINYTSLSNHFSIALWVKLTNTVSSYTEILNLAPGSGWATIRFGMVLPSNSTAISCTVANGTNYLGNAFQTSSIPLNTWTHICFIYNEGKLELYLNGSFLKSSTTTIQPDWEHVSTMGIGSAANGTEKSKSCLNDVRVYDHCLSPLEVKEISQGLILHYKLNDSESSQNLVTTEDCFDGATCFNGATSKYGYGTNTDMYKTTGMFQGRKSTKVYMGTDGLNTYPYVYFNSFSATGTIVHTLSFDYFPTSQNKLIPYSYNGAYDWTYVVNGISGSAANAAICPALTVNLNQWNHIEITARKTDTTNTTRGIGYIRIGSAKHISTTTDYWLFANVQIEEKDHATPYMGIGGIRDAKIVDSSGYGNDGIINGNLITNNNTSRYSSSTFFDGNTAAIKIPFNDIIKDKNYTVSCWTYKTTIGTKNYQTILGGPSGFELEARSGSNTNPLYRIHNWGGGTTPYEFNKWNHFCFVHTDANSKLYVNGELKITGTSANIPTGNYFIGSWSTATSQNYEGQMSDFRLYTTALSAEDILDLYHTPANIDNLGGIHGFEFEEKQGNSFATELLGNYNSTSVNWDNQNNQFTIVSPNGTGSRYGLVIKNVNSRRLIPWGYTYRFTFDIYVPITTNFNVDYNNYSNDSSVSLSGNDNDDTSKRLSASFTVNANIWTTVTLGSSNTSESKNPNHVTLYDQTNFGIKTDTATESVTWYLKNPQWYLIDINEATNYQVYQNGIFKNNFIKQDDTKDFASFRNKEKATWGTNFIEK